MKHTIVIKRADYSYIELFMLIFISVAPYISMTIKICLILLLGLIRAKNIKKISKYFYIAFLLMLIPSLADLFNITSDNPYSGNNFLYPLCMLVGALIATNYTVDSFLLIIEKILYFLAILSLVGMSVYFVAPGIIESFPTYTYYDLTHRTVYFFNYIYAQGFLMVRNSGIAWEPGVFQILMNLGLAISVKMFPQMDYKRVLIYTLAVILTRSTTGLLILMINLVIVIRRKKIFIIVLAIVALVFSSELISIVSEQINYKWVGTMAFDNRYMRSINAIAQSWNHPFGLGSTGYNAIYQAKGIGSFDSYTQVLMRYGYGLLLFLAFTLIRITKRTWYVGLIMGLSMLSESMWGSVFFTTIYFIYLEDKTGNMKPNKGIIAKIRGLA